MYLSMRERQAAKSSDTAYKHVGVTSLAEKQGQLETEGAGRPETSQPAADMPKPPPSDLVQLSPAFVRVEDPDEEVSRP